MSLPIQQIMIEPIKIFTHGVVRNLLGGASLCYALEQKAYAHVPLIAIFPSAYAGYQVFQNRERVASWLENLLLK